MKTYCVHVSCRLDALQELVAIYRAKGVPLTVREVQGKFIELKGKEVVCRHVARRGAVNAPFYREVPHG